LAQQFALSTCVCRRRGDARQIFADVLKKTDDRFLKVRKIKLAIKQLHTRSQFSACAEKLVGAEEVP
jgi:hypothetical protein